MKKSKLWICMAMSVCMLAGCGGFSPDETGVSVAKNGAVKSVAIENLDKDMRYHYTFKLPVFQHEIQIITKTMGITWLLFAEDCIKYL